MPLAVPYTKFKYFSPPRVETAGAVEALPKNHWTQIKKNGTNSMIFVGPNKELLGYNRHGEIHKAWQFTEKSSKAFLNLPKAGWQVINAELLHSKTPHIKDTNYIHDLLVHDGKYLIGSTYQQRYELLLALFGPQITGEGHDHFVINSNTVIAKNFNVDPVELFATLTAVEDEGLVTKNPKGIWIPGVTPNWMSKSRKPHKNYSA